MAGPGGGPPRKSHTKSRKGCKTCKRRHIRCDENFPQCRNCTKHNTRCDYMDSPPPEDAVKSDSQGGSQAMMEAEIENWMNTGIYPFPELALQHTFQFHGLTPQEIRLIYHVSNIYRDLSRKGLSSCTAWVEKLPLFLDAAAANGAEFVMSGILAFSAMRLGAETNSAEIIELAYHHRGIALNGLHTAIGHFSQENSDASLAASVLLSWQASEWNGWLSLVQGISTVLNSMELWKDASPLAYFIENQVIFRPRTFMPPTLGGGLMAPLLPEDDQSLNEAIHALRQLLVFLQNDVGLRHFVESILSTAEDIELSSRTTREDQLFEKLQFLRMRLLWAPVSLLQNLDQANMNLVAIAHLYAVALAVDASLPELNGAAFGTLTSAPIEEIDRRIRFSSPPNLESASPYDELMQFPRRMASKNSANQGSIVGSTGAGDPSLGQGSPYSFAGLHSDSAPHTPNFPPSFPMFTGNISVEDLSVPPSPFLSSYVPQQLPGSRRHSGLIETHSRPNSMNFDRRSFSALGYNRDDSPAYSPAGYGSPAHSFVDSDRGSVFGEGSPVPTWSVPSGNFGYDESAEKNKGRQSTGGTGV